MGREEADKRYREKHRDKLREDSKRYYQEHKEQHNEYARQWRIRNPNYSREYLRRRHLMVGGRHVTVSKRPRPDRCEVCGREVARLDYHHWDDRHPCLGLWLCHICHKMADSVDKGYHIVYLQEKEDMVLVTPA